MKLHIGFSGGLELLFNKKKSHDVDIPSHTTTLPFTELLEWIKLTMLKERPELFIIDGTVRPGILVLINDCDWELMGGLEYVVNDGDNLTFISTLHGG